MRRAEFKRKAGVMRRAWVMNKTEAVRRAVVLSRVGIRGGGLRL